MKIRFKPTATGNALLLLSMFLLSSCGGGGGGGNTPSPASSTATVEVVACPGSEAATVDAVGTSSFNPVSVTINAGQVVKWNNATVFDHTVTSDTVPANGTFNAALNRGTSVCLKFTAAGAFNYHCSPHPNMTGLVTVN